MSSKFFQMRKKAKEEPKNEVKEDKKEYITTDVPTKKAYNFFYDETKKLYMCEAVEYLGDKVVSITTDEVHMGIAMTMLAIKKLFTEKLILKKEGL